ncbi:MAG: prolyl oligopeptidase family protein [Parvularculaceae bacterium]
MFWLKPTRKKAAKAAERPAANAAATAARASSPPKAAALATQSRAEADPHIWLEDVDGEKALAWVRAENARTTETLEADVRFADLRDAARAIVNDRERIPAPSLNGDEVRNFWRDEASPRGIWRRASLASYLSGAPEWRTILDVDALAAAEDENWIFAGVTALAPDGDRAIVALSRGGADAAVRREFRVSSGRVVDGGFSLPEAKGGVAWENEDTILAAIADVDALGPDAATASGYPRLVRRLTRGAPLADAPVVFEGRADDVGVWPAAIVRGGRAYRFITRAITFFESEHYLLDEGGSPRLLPLPRKSEIEGVIDGFAIASLQADWRQGEAAFEKGDLVALHLVSGEASLVFRPTERQAVAGVATGGAAVFVELLDNVVGSILKIARAGDGWRREPVTLPGVGQASLGGVNPLGADAFVFFDSPTVPSTLYYLDKAGARRRVMQSPAYFDAGGVVMRQFEATSKDGVAVPYFVIGRSDAIESGRAPVIQYGYGGFEVPTTPGYAGVVGKLWLEKGGVYVIANIRGGGEFGPRWHQAALREYRQRAFDDFFAVSEDLISRGVATPARLGAYGGSNGGLLMGVALTQRPDLYGALAIGVPLLDMLRYHELLAGASWVDEYGDPTDPRMAEILRAYSPYHNVRPATAYPKPFFFTSTRDDRVHPGHARKMAARMREHGHDFLYYENIEGGHGAAANLDQLAYRAALQYAYFWSTLGGRATDAPADAPRLVPEAATRAAAAGETPMSPGVRRRIRRR